MKRFFTIAMLALSISAVAQNKMNVTLSGGNVESYNTSDLKNVVVKNGEVIVTPNEGEAVKYTSNVSNISFIKNAEGHVAITEANGWNESAYVKWNLFEGADNYYVYIKGGNYTDYTRIDYQLVRNYGTYGRADVPGLKAGTYQLKVVPVTGSTENTAAASETSQLTVKAYDRSGFAHFNYSTGIGAYNNDGTLKEGAKVFYITANTAKTVSTNVKTNDKGTTSTFTGWQTILDGYTKGYDDTPICFRIIGKVTLADLDKISSSSEGLQIKNNKNGKKMNVTIEGIGHDATIHGFGMLLRNAESVELRNFAVMWFMDDGISIDTDNRHCWIHHLDIFYGQPGSDSDQKKGDGSLDVKADSKYCTFAYNHFWDSGKSSLCGMSESAPNYLTYHHNWFDHSDSRHPRIRTMSVHVYNNYFDGISKYGVGATLGADVFVENNYFRNCKYPILTSMQGSDISGDGTGTFSSEDGGSVKSFGNVMAGKYTYVPYSSSASVEFDAYEATSRDEKVPSTVTAKQGGDTYSNWDTDTSLMYSYEADPANEIPSIIKGFFGAGRINHGDFRPVFADSYDTDYNVNTTLSTAIQNYNPYLVGLFENELTIGAGGAGTDAPDLGGDSGSGGSSSDEPGVTDGDAFMAGADGGYYWFSSTNKEQVDSWINDGTIILDGASFKPTFTHADYPTYTGAIQLNKESGVCIFKCPSVSTFKLQLLRTGSYNGNIYTSTDGSSYNKVTELEGSKGNKELDISNYVKSSSQIYVKIENTASGGLNIHGVKILKAATE